MFVDECHVTRVNQGLFSTTMEAEKRDPGNEVGIPCKRQRTDPYCIIHCTDDNTTLISPNSLDSWKTLQKAGEIRDHEGILTVQVTDDQIPNGVFYHRKCRSTGVFVCRNWLTKHS